MISWKKVPFQDELTEFKRVVVQFSDIISDRTKNLNELKNLYAKSHPMILKHSTWKILKNTDSFNIKTLNDVSKAIIRNEATRGSRQIDPIIKEFLNQSSRCPIILSHGDKDFTLIAGNTRLMIAKALEIDPVKVIIMETDW